MRTRAPQPSPGQFIVAADLAKSSERQGASDRSEARASRSLGRSASHPLLPALLPALWPDHGVDAAIAVELAPPRESGDRHRADDLFNFGQQIEKLNGSERTLFESSKLPMKYEVATLPIFVTAIGIGI